MELSEKIQMELLRESREPFLANLDWDSIEKAQKIRPTLMPDGMSSDLVDILILRINKILALERYSGTVPKNRAEYDEIVLQIKKANKSFLGD